MKKLKEHIEGSNNNLQLVGYPNTGKTSLLNILAKIKKSISKVPGTTIKITEHEYSRNIKRKVYDMPGLFSSNLLYNLIEKPSLKMMLTWHKRIAPGLLTNSAIIYGGKI
jgi:ribosome biogenesis GTPase A